MIWAITPQPTATRSAFRSPPMATNKTRKLAMVSFFLFTIYFPPPHNISHHILFSNENNENVALTYMAWAIATRPTPPAQAPAANKRKFGDGDYCCCRFSSPHHNPHSVYFQIKILPPQGLGYCPPTY